MCPQAGRGRAVHIRPHPPGLWRPASPRRHAQCGWDIRMDRNAARGALRAALNSGSRTRPSPFVPVTAPGTLPLFNPFSESQGSGPRGGKGLPQLQKDLILSTPSSFQVIHTEAFCEEECSRLLKPSSSSSSLVVKSATFTALRSVCVRHLGNGTRVRCTCLSSPLRLLCMKHWHLRGDGGRCGVFLTF